jgi:hypothetical protein
MFARFDRQTGYCFGCLRTREEAYELARDDGRLPPPDPEGASTTSGEAGNRYPARSVAEVSRRDGIECANAHSTRLCQQAAEEFCRRMGARLTRLRRNVLMLVVSAEHPLTAYEILDLLRPKDPSATPAGVYRSLDFLTELGLVHRKRQELHRLCDAGSHASQPNARLPTLRRGCRDRRFGGRESDRKSRTPSRLCPRS